MSLLEKLVERPGISAIALGVSAVYLLSEWVAVSIHFKAFNELGIPPFAYHTNTDLVMLAFRNSSAIQAAGLVAFMIGLFFIFAISAPDSSKRAMAGLLLFAGFASFIGLIWFTDHRAKTAVRAPNEERKDPLICGSCVATVTLTDGKQIENMVPLTTTSEYSLFVLRVNGNKSKKTLIVIRRDQIRMLQIAGF